MDQNLKKPDFWIFKFYTKTYTDFSCLVNIVIDMNDMISYNLKKNYIVPSSTVSLDYKKG